MRWRHIFWWVFRVGLALEGALLMTIIAYGFRGEAHSADVIIVLGSGVNADCSIPTTMRVRAEQGAALYDEDVAPVVICAGGVTGGAPRSEADACREALGDAGVPAEAVLLEERSINTFTNAQYTLDLMNQNGYTSAVVVSSRYHLLRARWLFWRRDRTVQISTFPARIGYLTPSEIFYSYTREWAAFHWQLVRDVVDVPHFRVPVP
ncbi:MAG: YdcF family protein [Chloroflexota bacterium]